MKDTLTQLKETLEIMKRQSFDKMFQSATSRDYTRANEEQIKHNMIDFILLMKFVKDS